jgi:hypothetical protein
MSLSKLCLECCSGKDNYKPNKRRITPTTAISRRFSVEAKFLKTHLLKRINKRVINSGRDILRILFFASSVEAVSLEIRIRGTNIENLPSDLQVFADLQPIVRGPVHVCFCPGTKGIEAGSH